MFITVSKLGGRFIFAVGDNPNDASGAWVSSINDSAILGDIPPTFSSFGEAHAVASRIVDDRPSLVLAKKASFYSLADEAETASNISAEDQVMSHYNEQVELIGQRVAGLGGIEPSDRKDVVEAVKKEIDGVKVEMERLFPIIEDETNKQQFESLFQHVRELLKTISSLSEVKTASIMPGLASLRRTAVRAFSEAAMTALTPLHKEIFVKGASYDPKTRVSSSVLATPDGDVVRLSFDGCLLLSDISPCVKTASAHSDEFRRNYWEPIVHAVGHFRHAGSDMVAVTDMDKSSRNKFKAFVISDGSQGELEVKPTIISGVKTWLIKKATTVTAPPRSPIVVDDEIECNAQHLPSYAGRTGIVCAVAEKPNGRLYRVDFRRGLGVVWMEEKNIHKVNLGQ